MYILTVALISRSIPIPTLPYMSRTAYSVGECVSIPFQTGVYTGVIVACVDALSVRTDVKNAGFRLKGGVTSLGYSLPNDYINQLVSICEQQLLPISTVFHAFFNPLLPFLSQAEFQENRGLDQIFCLQQARLDRYALYSEYSSPDQSPICIVFPSAAFARSYASHDSSVQTLLTETSWKKLSSSQHQPARIVTTLEYLPRILNLCKTIIFDQIQNPLYRLSINKRSFIDRIPLWVNLLSFLPGYTVVMTDSVLPIRDTMTLAPWNTSVHSYIVPQSLRHSERPKEERKKPMETYHFEQWINHVTSAPPSASHCIIANQKEWFGYTHCPSCGYAKLCPSCKGYLRTERNPETQSLGFACSSCNHKEPVWDMCDQCGGYTLSSVRMGTAHYQNRLQEIFPDRLCILLTADTKSPLTTMNTWVEAGGGILVTTNTLYSYPPDKPSFSLYVAPSLSPEGANTAPESLLWQIATLAEYADQLYIPKELYNRIYYKTQEHSPSLHTWDEQAHHEQSQSLLHGVPIPCTLW
jgi:hypothetical protein